MKMVFIRQCVGILAITVSLTGCAMDNMTTTQKALLVGSAAAAAGGIAYGIHKKHEADKAKHEKDEDNRHKENTYHAHRHHSDQREQCYDYEGHWQC
ncbi:hypothetical protein [Aeromonas sp. NJAU223]|uniref:hypothetical protein n=1 Tax=Aeromonas sp. NJAU223 TaxID=3115650 RepID=UPI003DA90CBC